MARVCFYAAARDAAGTTEAVFDVDRTADLVGALVGEYGAAMAKVLRTATLLVDGIHVSPRDDVALQPDQTVDVLPPFAGG
jgi:molybdopterin synthase sulfur carrier subunit